MSHLEVAGARLYYETHGSGPVLMMIAGANGSADAFRRITEHLAADYTVVIYDRRGFSRSELDGPQDGARRLDIDADDAGRLLQHVGGEPATVFGSSSGAIVAMQLLTRNPSVVRTLVPFEPPAVKLLPDGRRWLDFFSELYDLYRHAGLEPANEKFQQQVLTVSDRQALARATDRGDRNQIVANSTYWIEHELRQYPAADLDLDTLNVRTDRILPMVGRESSGFPAHEAAVELGRRLDRDVITMPGGHLGFLSQPAQFARELREHLEGQREGPGA